MGVESKTVRVYGFENKTWESREPCCHVFVWLWEWNHECLHCFVLSLHGKSMRWTVSLEKNCPSLSLSFHLTLHGYRCMVRFVCGFVFLSCLPCPRVHGEGVMSLLCYFVYPYMKVTWWDETLHGVAESFPFPCFTLSNLCLYVKGRRKRANFLPHPFALVWAIWPNLIVNFWSILTTLLGLALFGLFHSFICFLLSYLSICPSFFLFFALIYLLTTNVFYLREIQKITKKRKFRYELVSSSYYVFWYE